MALYVTAKYILLISNRIRPYRISLILLYFTHNVQKCPTMAGNVRLKFSLIELMFFSSVEGCVLRNCLCLLYVLNDSCSFGSCDAGKV